MKIFIVNNFSPKEQIGGSEIQCWLLAKYLAKNGHQTAYIALRGLSIKNQDEGEGFRIYYLSHRKDGKFKIFQNFYKLLKQEKPDICYIRFFRYLFFLYNICKILKIPVVFNTSHINDCTPDLVKLKFSLNPYSFLKLLRSVIQRRLNFWALKRTEIITINKYHAKLFKEKYNLNATPIYNSMEDNYDKYRGIKNKQVVWVNNIKVRKRPELFIDLADSLKDNGYKFLMIGYFQNNIEHYKNIVEECEKNNSNFKYLGGKTPEEVDKILAESEIMVNTCEPEGFGNSFIQAWLAECPTVTLSFDADDIMKKNKIGFHSITFGQMIKDVKILMNNKRLRKEMGDRARKYALVNHTIVSNVRRYEKKFEEIVYAKNNKKNK